jgi:hypothetical protein
MIPSRDTVTQVTRTVAAAHGVAVRDILGKTRQRKVVKARAETIQALAEAGGGRYTLTGLGRALGLTHGAIRYWLVSEDARAKRRARGLADYYRRAQ